MEDNELKRDLVFNKGTWRELLFQVKFLKES